jgi:hypothetical protein
MIEGSWFRTDATGRYAVLELAFVGEVSMVRASFVTEKDVDAVLDRAGAPRFIKYGIAELDADEIIKRTRGQFRMTPDASWPPNAHVLFIRQTGGKSLKASHPEVSELTDLTNAKPLLRIPKP